LYLKGDLTVAASANIYNSNSNGWGYLIFNGTGDGSNAANIQSIDIASTGTNRNKAIGFYVNSGAYVQLSRNLELGTGAKFVDSTGGTFDFGFSGSTPLAITIVSGATSTGFTSQSNSTLKITSPDGLYEQWDRAAFTAVGVTVNTGNLQGCTEKQSKY
jgi:hypothetical protein